MKVAWLLMGIFRSLAIGFTVIGIRAGLMSEFNPVTDRMASVLGWPGVYAANMVLWLVVGAFIRSFLALQPPAQLIRLVKRLMVVTTATMALDMLIDGTVLVLAVAGT